MSKEYSDQDYYWEKAEFQDPVSHRKHVKNYKRGIRSSIAFDEEYTKEALKEMLLEGYTAITCVACGKREYYTTNCVAFLKKPYYYCGECSAKIREYPNIVLGSFSTLDVLKGEEK